MSSRKLSGDFLRDYGGFQVRGLLDFSDDFSVSETGVPGDWTRVSEDLRSRYLCDGEAG